MKNIVKFFLGSVLSVAATAAFASPPAAVCLNMPLTITPLNGGDMTVKKMVLPLCFETKDFVLDGNGNYVSKKPFIRVYGNGGFSENVAWHSSPCFVVRSQGRFLFRDLSGVWESIFASFLSTALKGEGLVSVAVGSLGGSFASVSGNARSVNGEKTVYYAQLWFGRPTTTGSDPYDNVSAIGYSRTGAKYDLWIAPSDPFWGYSVSIVEQ